MIDILVLGIGLGSFALFAVYVAACDRVWRTMLDLILGGVVAAGLLTYLLWALLRPESL